MKMRNYFFAAALVVLAASCVKENAPESSEKTTVNYVPMEFTSSVETKTVLAADGKVNWLAGDRISIFDNSATAETHNNSFETTGDGSFTGEVPEDASEFYALYPYREASSLTDGAISINLPAEQTATLGSFADDLAIMVAKADEQGKLAFKNVCSHIKFTLAEELTDVKSITLMGNKAEILAGPATVDMSDGDPKITVSITNSAQTYVTLRNSDGTALTPGDYYFTVLPVTFTEGFTVILSKMDGSQVAKKTTKPRNELASRNKILVMKPLASSDYTKHMNYFVKYNDGFDLTFGDVTINKNTHKGGVLASDNRKNSWNTGQKNNVVIFVDPNCTQARVNNSYAYDSLVVVGADSLRKSSFKTEKIVRFKDGGSLVMFANLACDVNSNTGFTQHKSALFSTFGNIVISGCHFKNMTKHLFDFSLQAITKLSVTIEDTDFAFGAGSIYLFYFGDEINHSIDNITFRNNVYYSANGTQVAECKLVGGEKTIVKNLVAEKSTYDKIAVPNGGLCRFVSCEVVNFSNNIFVDCNVSGVKGNLMSLRAVPDKTAVKGYNYMNFYYTTTKESSLLTGMSTKDYTNKEIKISAPAVLNGSPLSDSWKPANEVYRAYKKVTYPGSDGNPKDLPSSAGAQRPDMTAKPNSASYRYPATDLGSF